MEDSGFDEFLLYFKDLTFCRISTQLTNTEH